MKTSVLKLKPEEESQGGDLSYYYSGGEGKERCVGTVPVPVVVH
jgi:hypothetical protein